MPFDVNQFSINIEQLIEKMRQDAIEHHQVIWPSEEQERWVSHRSQVLHAQLTVLERFLESPANRDIAKLNQEYQAALDELEQSFQTRYRELLESRLSPTHPVYLYDPNQNQFVELNATERQNRLTQFQDQLAIEMPLHRGFIFKNNETLPDLQQNLHDEWELAEKELDDLKEKMNRLNEPIVEKESEIRRQIRKVEKERGRALEEVQKHEQFLTDCKNGELNAVDRYLQTLPDSAARQAIINQSGAGGRNGFHFACEQGQLPVVQFLLEMGADVHCPTDRGRLPIHLAVHTDNGAQTETLLDVLEMKGANLHAPDPNQRTALNEAAYCGNVTAARWLLNKGAALENQDVQGRTALHAAAAQGHREMVAFLLDQRADSKITNAVGETSLIEAILNGQAAVAQLFFDRGLWLSQPEYEILLRRREFKSAAAQHAHNFPLQTALVHAQAVLPQLPVNNNAAVSKVTVAEGSNKQKTRTGWLSGLFDSRAPIQAPAPTTTAATPEAGASSSSPSTMQTSR